MAGLQIENGAIDPVLTLPARWDFGHALPFNATKMQESLVGIIFRLFPHAEMREWHCHWTIPTYENERMVVPLDNSYLQEQQKRITFRLFPHAEMGEWHCLPAVLS